MKIFKKMGILTLCGMTCLLPFLMTGCGKKDDNVINLSEVTHSTFYAPLYVAMNNGYFEDEGLKINLTNGGGSNNSMSALVSGDADIVLVGPETVVYTNQEGIADQPKVFGQLTQTDGAFIVAKNYEGNVDDFTLEDLKGESIIGGREGGLPAMSLQYVIEEEANLTLGTGENEVDLIDNVEFNAIGSTFASDDSVKYCTLFEPTASSFVANSNGEYKIVAPVSKFLTESVPYTCFVAKNSFLEEKSEKSEKFLRAVKKGYEFLKKSVQDNNLQPAINALKPSFSGISDIELGYAIESYVEIDAWANNFAMTQTSYDMLISITQNAGKTDGVDFDDVVYNKIAEKLNA